jgi:tRNA pseudouridine55 synthase
MSEEKYHGLVLVDKPQGWTSHDLVAKARKIFATKSVGHCGTLDPMASGLMILLIGEATKLSNYILEKDKSYRVRAQLGVVTDTLDTTGKILEQHPVDLTQERVLQAAVDLQGEMELPVPMYSAVKIDGMKLYEYARKGEVIEQPMKKMSFCDFQNFEQGTDWIEFEMTCIKGSYVRAWVHEFGKRLGCGAAMSALVRTSSQPYTLEQAKNLEQITKIQESGELESLVIPMNMALPEYRCLKVSGHDETLFNNGQISHGVKSQLISLFRPGVDEGVKVLSQRESKLLGLVALEQGKGFVIRRVFRS